jgi:ABC-2 type transport system permease protein
VTFLQSDNFTKLIRVSVAPDEASARRAVDSQQAGVAIIIPANFSSTIMNGATGAATAVTLYLDPTLKLGPGIVRELIGHFLDHFNGSRIAGGVLAAQSSKSGLPVDSAALQLAALQYSQWAQAQSSQPAQLLDLQPPASQSATNKPLVSLVGAVMAGMMLFFVFFTGANTAESIVKEDEEGTLARLFTTPTSRPIILAGKFIAVFITLLVQVVTLVVVSALLFGINWGAPLPVGFMAFGTAILAAGFGLLLISFVKNSRQSGPVVGGVMAVTGMVGGLMTTGFGNVPSFFGFLNLLTPQGWALKGWTITLDGGGVADIIGPWLVSIALGLALLGAATLVFRRRFA